MVRPVPDPGPGGVHEQRAAGAVERVHRRRARVDHGLQQVAALLELLADFERFEPETDFGRDFRERADGRRAERVGLCRVDHQCGDDAPPHAHRDGGGAADAGLAGQLAPRLRARVLQEPVDDDRAAVFQARTHGDLPLRIVAALARLQVRQVAAVVAERRGEFDTTVRPRLRDPGEQEPAVLDGDAGDRLVQRRPVAQPRDRVVAAREHVVEVALALETPSCRHELALVADDALHVRAPLEFHAARTHLDRQQPAAARPVFRLEHERAPGEHFAELVVGDRATLVGPQVEDRLAQEFVARVAVRDFRPLVAVDDVAVPVEQQDHVVGMATHPGHALRREARAGLGAGQQRGIVALFGPPPQREQQRGQCDESEALERADQQQQVGRVAEQPAHHDVGAEDPGQAEQQVQQRQPASPARRRLGRGHGWTLNPAVDGWIPMARVATHVMV